MRPLINGEKAVVHGPVPDSPVGRAAAEQCAWDQAHFDPYACKPWQHGMRTAHGITRGVIDSLGSGPGRRAARTPPSRDSDDTSTAAKGPHVLAHGPGVAPWTRADRARPSAVSIGKTRGCRPGQ